ncbi:MAG: ABC transporter ATP-binding protein [Promethearchaeota archaeon]
MKTPIIQTFNLTKKYGKLLAVDNLNLEISKGIYGFLGPNGAGKTTTIKMLIGSLLPTSGHIEIFGEDITGNKNMSIHERLGYVPEHPTYFLGMTADKLLRYIGSIFHMSKQEIDKRISDLLKLVNLTEARNRAIVKYSAGMKQRFGIAQALMNDPELLILDEITSNLDPLGRNAMINLINDLRKEGKTIFISTHVLPEIQKMNVDSIGIINEGHLVMEGSLDELNKKLGRKLVRLKPNNEMFRKSLEPLVLTISEESNALIFETDQLEKAWQTIADISLKNNIAVSEFRSSEFEIEQIFLKAINKKEIRREEKSE